MIKKNLKLLIITSIIVLLPVIIGLIFWDKLPDEIPSHWNISGEIDGWSSKPFSVFGLPLILLAIQWSVVLVSLADPKRKNHSPKILNLMFWLIPVLSVVLSLVSYLSAMGMEVHVELVIPIILGLFFVAIGNYMPKCKQNYTIGIKLPWTLNNEENWNKTHRLGGWLLIIGGIGMIIAGFLNEIWMFIPIALIVTIIPAIYSYVLHRKGL